MDNNKIIIIALIAVIIALLVGIAAMMPNMGKEDTQLTFKGDSKISEGDAVKFKLTDVGGVALSEQTVNVTVIDKDDARDYHSVVTSDNGNGKLKLDKDPGKYRIEISFGGNDNYNGCNATKKITIKEEVEQAETTSSSSSQPTAYAYKSDGTPMYSQAEVDQYMANKYGLVNYHVGSNGYIDMDEPGFDDAGNYIGY